MRRNMLLGIVMLLTSISSPQTIHHVRTIIPCEKKTIFNRFKRVLFGREDLQLQPHGIAKLADGHLAVTDTRLPAVVLLNPDGTIERTVRKVGETPLGMPVGICGDGSGGVYVGYGRSALCCGHGQPSGSRI